MQIDAEKVKPYDSAAGKTGQVEAMFDSIAPAYDTMNRLMTMGIDRSWRRKAVEMVASSAPRSILDVATGTGDFAIALAEAVPGATVTGIDLSGQMLAIGRRKVEKASLDGRITLQKGDCLALPFADGSFDAITVAFGIRNFEDLDKGLSEMCRVLKPGGHLVILELTTPDRFPMKQLFSIYSKVVIPLLGKLLSKDKSAYRYLPDTIKVFPQGEVMKGVIARAGFSEVNFKRLTFGICTLYTATK